MRPIPIIVVNHSIVVSSLYSYVVEGSWCLFIRPISGHVRSAQSKGRRGFDDRGDAFSVDKFRVVWRCTHSAPAWQYLQHLYQCERRTALSWSSYLMTWIRQFLFLNAELMFVMGVEMMEKSEVSRTVEVYKLDRFSPQNSDKRHQLLRIPDPPRSKTSE